MRRVARRLAGLIGAGSLSLAPLLAARAAEAATLITFDSVPGATPLLYTSSSPVPAASQLTTQLQISDGVRFSSSPGYAALVRLGTGHATSGLDGVGGVASSGILDYQELLIAFTMPGDPDQDAATDSVSIRGDLKAIAGTATLEAFDADGLPLGSVTIPDSAGLTLALSLPGMHSLRVTSSSGTIAFDDLAFDDLTPVPEPTSAHGWAGLALLASRWRRRAPRRGAHSSEPLRSTIATLK